MKLRFKTWGYLVLVTIVCLAVLVGCGSKELSSDYNEDEVRSAAENAIAIFNNLDAEGLREISTAQMKLGLTDDVLEGVFAIVEEGGEFQEITKISIGGSKDKESGEEYAVVVAKAKYKKKTFTYTITLTKEMKLAGLYFK